MMHPSLLASGILDGVTAALLLTLGATLSRRPVASRDGRFAWRAYCVWWIAGGVAAAATSASALLGAAGYVDPGIVMTQWFFERLFASVAAWGLLSYVVYLYTGNGRAWLPLAAAYGAVFVVWLAEALARPPTSIVLHAWGRPMLADGEATPVLLAASALLLLLPPLGAAAAMLLTGLVLERPQQRCRIRMAAASVALLLVPGAFAFMLAWSPTVQLAARALQVAGAALALLAYRPPSRLAEALEDAPPAPHGPGRAS